jgi:hypothetical protein
MSQVAGEATLQAPIQPRKGPLRYLWVIGVGVYVAIAWYLGWRGIRDAMASIELRWLFAAIAVDAAGHWLRALKWRLALGPGTRAIGLFWLSKGVGYWTPMRAGELAPLMLPKYRTPRMGAWIVLDRVLEIAVTLALGAVGLLALQIPGVGVYVGMALVVVVLTVGPLLLLMQRSWFLRLAKYFPDGSLPQRGATFVAEMQPEFRKLGGRVPLASALTLLAGCMDIWGGMLLYMMFGFPLTFALIAAAKCIHALISAIPITPNATAVPYVATGALLVQAGGVSSDVVLAAVSIHLVIVNTVFWTSLGIGSMDLRDRA